MSKGKEDKKGKSQQDDSLNHEQTETTPYDRTSAPHDLGKYRGDEEYLRYAIYERPEVEGRKREDGLQCEQATVERDDMILDAINERLTWSRQVESAGIRVKVDRGVVTLSGQVDSAGDRQIAEDEVLAIEGVREVINKLDVQQVG